jgi:hypothetical protein
MRLSPAHGINPSIDRRDRSLAINEVETACDVAMAHSRLRLTDGPGDDETVITGPRSGFRMPP